LKDILPSTFLFLAAAGLFIFSMHRRLLALTRDTRLPLFSTILTGVLAGLLTIWQAWLLSTTIQQVYLDQHTLQQVWKLMLLMLAAIAGRALLTWLNEISANAVAVRIKTNLRERLFAHILKLGPAYSRGQRTGELTTAAVEGIEALDAYYSQYLPQLVITALVPLSILMVAFPLDLLSGTIFLVTAPLIPFFMIMIGRGAEIVTRRQYEALRLLSAHFLDSLQGLTTLKLFGQSKAQASSIAQTSEQYRDATLGVLRVTFLSALTLELLATLSTAIIAVEIGFRLLYGRMDFQPALFLLVLAPEFYMPLRALAARFHAGMAGATAARRIFEILDIPVPSRGIRRTPPAEDTRSGILELRLEKVSFTYPQESTPALQDINCSFPCGRHIALVGKTGAGKSTLINLLLGFIHPKSGRVITSYEHLVTDHSPSIDSIAWVPQRPHLFHDTIAANIRLGRADATQEDVAQAAISARLGDFIESLPGKYATVIGEGGARLSSGQAQRLAIARAFLKDAPILILDEPTSSLDPETEALLEESTRALMRGRTVITIAHRLNTIFQADSIIVLDGGRIIEQGTHRELLANRGLYAALIRTHLYPGEENTSGDSSMDPPPTSDSRSLAVNPRSAVYVPSIPAAKGPRDAVHGGKILPRLLSFLNGEWPRVALSVCIGAGTIGSSIALMGTSAWLISTAALHPSVADLGVSVVGVRFFGIARGLLRYAERLVSHEVTLRLLSRLRTWFYEILEPLAPARLTEFRAGDLLARIIGDVETLENFYVRVVSPPMTAILVGLLTAIFLAAFHPLLAPVYLAFCLGAGLLLPALVQFLSRRHAIQTVQLRAELHACLVDGIQGMADLLSFGREGQRLSEVSSIGLRYGDAQRRMVRVLGFHSSLSLLVTHLGSWSVLFLCIPLVEDGALAGPMLASLTLLTLASFEAVTPMAYAAQMWNASREAALRLFEIVDMEPVVIDRLPTTSRRSHPISNDEIRIKNVTFAYPRQPEPVLRDITFDIHPSKTIAIVGPSGAGKSTLANVLLRFWDFDSGEITLGGESLKRLEQDEVRARIGLISQNPYLFNTSIYENLRFARRGVTREEIESAARDAQIHEFILRLPKAYDTLVGEQGLRLSGGERQRLGIARALIKDAPIVVLDEPTANLDALTERQVLETLYHVIGQKTSLWITHRLIGLERVDEILVMERGLIAERGTHDSLIKQNGLYSRMFELQNRMLEA